MSLGIKEVQGNLVAQGRRQANVLNLQSCRASRKGHKRKGILGAMEGKE
jgi:hypothetical protein